MKKDYIEEVMTSFKEYYPTGVYAKLIKNGEFVETTETIQSFIKQSLQEQERKIKEKIVSMKANEKDIEKTEPIVQIYLRGKNLTIDDILRQIIN